MTRIVFVTLLVIVGSISFTVQLQCPPGEVEDTCPTACSRDDYCPTQEIKNFKCSVTSDCGAPICKCPFNQRRGLHGSCINISTCPGFDCGPNEEYVACPPLCPTDDCKQASSDGQCAFSGFMYVLPVIECNPACRCVKGYWRKDGKCVPYAECLQAN